MRLRTALLVTMAAACTLGGPARDPEPDPAPPPPARVAPPHEPTTPDAPPTTPDAPPTTPDAPPEAAPRPLADPGPPRPLTEAERDAMRGVTWHEGCPVSLDDLRVVPVVHHTPDGGEQAGELVVHADVADAIVAVFAELRRERFPIVSVRPAREFGGVDAASMAADNTSAFNCRPIAPGARWSDHARGRAVDLNPLRNPWVKGDKIRPPAGRDWVDRDPARPGVIVAGGPADQAFRAIGWRWGGRWRSAKDYQHFSESGW